MNEKISIRDLKFFYGTSLALKGINIPLYANKVTAFIGPSGCGKSTLLRVLNRMYDLYPNQHAEGQVLFDGRNILDPDVDLNLLRARIGMVFQKPTPFPMTIYDNIAFGLKLYETLSKSELDGRVEDALKRAACRRACVDFPVPSPPSSVTNRPAGLAAALTSFSTAARVDASSSARLSSATFRISSICRYTSARSAFSF